jgi:hypothetical protein
MRKQQYIKEVMTMLLLLQLHQARVKLTRHTCALRAIPGRASWAHTLLLDGIPHATRGATGGIVDVHVGGCAVALGAVPGRVDGAARNSCIGWKKRKRGERGVIVRLGAWVAWVAWVEGMGGGLSISHTLIAERHSLAPTTEIVVTEPDTCSRCRLAPLAFPTR